MMNELLKIQQDMGAPQQQQHRHKAAVRDEDEEDILSDLMTGWPICQIWHLSPWLYNQSLVTSPVA